jgi:hypothetical protein
MDLNELENTLIKILASKHREITMIELVAIHEIFQLGRENFKEKYWIFFQ